MSDNGLGTESRPPRRRAVRVPPGAFRRVAHAYPRIAHAELHPLVEAFLSLDNARIATRYGHLHPKVDAQGLLAVLSYSPSLFRWSGADLLHATDESGLRRMVVVETNSCPSGQKSMPLLDPKDEQGGYRQLLARSFLPLLHGDLPPGDLAVIYDKNPMEASGYAAALADLVQEPVHLVEMPDRDPDPPARFLADGTLEIRDENGVARPIRAAFRYVTQRPWNRIPLSTRTLVFNPVVACLAGGRNKMVAAKAYEFYNAELAGSGLQIQTPETIRDVRLEEVPLWVRRFGGQAVVKVPYSNAGQGVYTITSAAELDALMNAPQAYERFVVQSLIGNYRWSSRTQAGRLYHVGTIPDRHRHLYVADLRVMIGAGTDGFRPLAIYARRAREPLADVLRPGVRSWDMLGTNLSVKRPDGGWDTETHRLVPVDREDFHRLGLGIDELVEAYVQTVLATVAIDRMAQDLVGPKGRFRFQLFRSLDDDAKLLREIRP
jgi:hypothetical protein